MKKTILKVLALTTLLAFTTPIYANAAELKADKTEMTKGELIEITVKTNDPVELMQFDLKFDNQKYKYEDVASELDLTAARVIKEDNNGGIVRVSAFDTNGDKTNTLTLQFRAIEEGENIPSFSIDQDAVIELIGEKEEGFDGETTITVDKIGSAIVEYPDGEYGGDGNNNPIGDGKYVNDEGKEITELPQTGDTTKKAVGRFSRLGNITNIIPYALADSDEYVSLKDDVQTQFTAATNPSIGAEDIIKTGDTIDIPNEQSVAIRHTFILYGDVNKDGKITTSDALAIYKGKTRDGNIFDDFQKEAADIKNDGIVNEDDANAVQSFVLKTRQTETGTIISKYPVKTIEQADFLQPAKNDDTKYSYTNVTVAGFTVRNGTKLTEELLKDATIITGPNGDVSKDKISYEIEAEGTEATMKLYVEEPGEYSISIVIKGNEEAVENGRVNVFNDTVIVEKNEAITRIELTESSMVVGVAENQPETTSIKLYHSDYDINGNIIAGSEKLIDDPATAANITIQKASNSHLKAVNILNSDGKEITFDANGAITSGQGSPVGYLAIQAQEVTQKTSETLTIKADNSVYYGDNKKDTSVELNIAIDPFKGKTGLRINDKKVADGDKIKINIYEEEPTANLSNVELGDDGLIYTLLAISYGQGESVRMQDVKSTSGNTYKDMNGKIAIVENANPDAGTEMSVMGYISRDEDDFESPFIKTGAVEKVAIAYSARTNANVELLKQGITIWYDEEVGDTIERAKVEVEVTFIPAISSRSLSDDFEIPTEPEEADSEDIVYDDSDEEDSKELVDSEGEEDDLSSEGEESVGPEQTEKEGENLESSGDGTDDTPPLTTIPIENQLLDTEIPIDNKQQTI